MCTALRSIRFAGNVADSILVSASGMFRRGTVIPAGDMPLDAWAVARPEPGLGSRRRYREHVELWAKSLLTCAFTGCDSSGFGAGHGS